MLKRYSEMTKEELLSEMEQLYKKVEELKKDGNSSAFAIYEQKYYMAKSYYIDPDLIQPHQTYKVEGYSQPFTVEYLNGIMAWGRFPSSFELEAVPIGRLEARSEM